MNLRFFLDVDGVLHDWTGQAAKLFGVDRAIFVTHEGHKHLGISKAKMWDTINDAGPSFWQGELLPWANELYGFCQSLGEVYLLTSPSADDSSFIGKRKWIRKHFGQQGLSKTLIASCKEACAYDGSVLIDDYDTNYEKFKAGGGRAILFPQPWNRNRCLSEQRMTYTKQAINKCLGEI